MMTFFKYLVLISLLFSPFPASAGIGDILNKFKGACAYMFSPKHRALQRQRVQEEQTRVKELIASVPEILHKIAAAETSHLQGEGGQDFRESGEFERLLHSSQIDLNALKQYVREVSTGRGVAHAAGVLKAGIHHIYSTKVGDFRISKVAKHQRPLLDTALNPLNNVKVILEILSILEPKSAVEVVFILHERTIDRSFLAESLDIVVETESAKTLSMFINVLGGHLQADRISSKKPPWYLKAPNMDRVLSILENAPADKRPAPHHLARVLIKYFEANKESNRVPGDVAKAHLGGYWWTPTIGQVATKGNLMIFFSSPDKNKIDTSRKVIYWLQVMKRADRYFDTNHHTHDCSAELRQIYNQYRDMLQRSANQSP